MDMRIYAWFPGGTCVDEGLRMYMQIYACAYAHMHKAYTSAPGIWKISMRTAIPDVVLR